PTSPQLRVHAAHPVVRELALDRVDELEQLGIAEGRLGRVWPVVIAAARQADHEASPSDRSAGGPVMINEGSLLRTSAGRGVFLSRSTCMVSSPTLRCRAAMVSSRSSSKPGSASSWDNSPRSNWPSQSVINWPDKRCLRWASERLITPLLMSLQSWILNCHVKRRIGRVGMDLLLGKARSAYPSQDPPWSSRGGTLLPQGGVYGVPRGLV